jgi:uncharacterized protein YkwD
VTVAPPLPTDLSVSTPLTVSTPASTAPATTKQKSTAAPAATTVVTSHQAANPPNPVTVNKPVNPAPRPPAKKPAPKPKPKPAPRPVAYSNSGIANALLGMINSERHAHGLASLGWSSRLVSSAHGHNLKMNSTGQFSHQVSGEASLGARIDAVGYNWTSCAENIAWGSVTSLSLAESLQSDMYHEQPCSDGHRQNILGTSYHYVGIDVLTGTNGKMWITQDFGS